MSNLYDPYSVVFTNDESVDLIRTFKETGDVAYRNQVIEGNLRLVLKIANEFGYNHRVSFDDLLQEGMLGLLSAIHHFDRMLYASYPVTSLCTDACWYP